MVTCGFGECSTKATRDIGGSGFCDRHAALMLRSGTRANGTAPAPDPDGYTQVLATFSDGSQVLIWEWNDGTVQVAKRIEAAATWGPPAKGERLSP